MRHAAFIVVYEDGDLVVIKDIGPWDRHPTVTNDAEFVCEQLAPMMRGRRLEYIDSCGEQCELLIKDGRHVGFGPAIARLEAR